MAGVFKVQRLDKLLKQFEQFGEDAKKVANAELEDGARAIAGDAKKNAPANHSELRNGIQFVRTKDLQFEVIAHAPYSGYVEFGTGMKVEVPKELQEIAQAIRNNPKGDFKDGLESIKDWLRAKKKDERAAWIVLMTILREGLTPRPFLYPAWTKNGPKIFNNLDAAIGKQIKKFNAKK